MYEYRETAWILIDKVLPTFVCEYMSEEVEFTHVLEQVSM
jgi:hypothetical protein